jgi:nitrate reductase beta subunit
MTACVGKIRMQGLVDVDLDGQWLREPDNPLYFLVHEEKVALPLYPQFGTEPNVYYIPPRWVPRPYLRQMFGPGVDEAIERYTNPSRKLLAVLQLFRTAQAIIFRFEIEQGPKVTEINVNGRRQEIFNDTAIAFDANDNEIVRVSVQEPFFERPGKQNSI